MDTPFFLSAALKATLLAIATLAAVSVTPKHQPKLRRGLALLGVLSLVWLPWLNLYFLPMPMSMPMLAANRTTELATAGTAWLGVLMLAIWALGALLWTVRRGREVWSLHRLVATGQPSGPGVLLVPELASPCVFALRPKSILMPASATSWPAPQWQAAVAHERQHLQQQDHFLRLLTAVLNAVFWWNPFVAKLCRRLELESEFCCDAAATACLDKRSYAEMLLDLAVAQPTATVAAAWAGGNGLKERLCQLLLTVPCSRGRAISSYILATLLLTTGLAVAFSYRTRASIPPATQKPQEAQAQEASIRLQAEAFPEG